MTDHEAWTRQTRFGALDGFRALCILAVLWHHAPIRESLALPLASRGFLGVDAFSCSRAF